LFDIELAPFLRQGELAQERGFASLTFALPGKAPDAQALSARCFRATRVSLKA
jgi:hypothetical protein